MARIFISYSRQDEAFARKVARFLSDGGVEVWLDVDDIPAGANWSNAIDEGLRLCDLMLLILTPESMASTNVADEWQSYHQKKPIVPLLLRYTAVHYQLQRLQYVNFADQAFDTAAKQLTGELKRHGITLKSGMGSESSQAIPVQPILPQAPETEAPKRRGRWVLGAGFVVLLMIAGLLVVPPLLNPTDTGTPTPTSGSTIQQSSTTPEPMPTETPLEIALVVATLDAQATSGQATLYIVETAAARATEYAVGTLSAANQTMTATLWTQTPTPNITASIEAYRTQQADTATAQSMTEANRASQARIGTRVGMTLTAMWVTSTPAPTIEPLEVALERARTFSGGNTDWEQFAYVFPDDPASAEMMLVPAGEFMMGSEDGNDNEKPVHPQTFTEPFWIDLTEVTRGQYRLCVEAGACTEAPANEYSSRDTQPINYVTWFQARDFCAWQGARLPTEAEWEYAARGGDGWVYPWGDEWNPDNAVWSGNSNNETADAGSLAAGASWVGAVDMSGNVWEWVSSLYQAYPYDSADGREEGTGNRTDVSRVLRGGSFFGDTSILRAARRFGYHPDLEYSDFGFRCVLSS